MIYLNDRLIVTTTSRRFRRACAIFTTITTTLIAVAIFAITRFIITSHKSNIIAVRKKTTLILR